MWSKSLIFGVKSLRRFANIKSPLSGRISHIRYNSLLQQEQTLINLTEPWMRDCFTRFIRKIKLFFQHGGDGERSPPQVPKNAHNFLMTARQMS